WIAGGLLRAKTVLWAAGVTTSPLLKSLGTELDKLGRAKGESDLSLPGHPNVFVIGDAAAVQQEGHFLPGLAPVAMQEGRYVARVIQDRVRAGLGLAPTTPFRFFSTTKFVT